MEGAHVALSGSAGFIKRTVMSGGDGQFAFTGLLPAVYKIAVSGQGMSNFTSSPIPLRANQVFIAPKMTAAQVEHARSFFRPHPYETLGEIEPMGHAGAEFRAWYRYNTRAHKVPGYRVVFVSLKPHGGAPGDITAQQMEAVADLADEVSFGEIRATHNQNLVLADVKQADLLKTWQRLRRLALATPNIGTLTDMIVLPRTGFLQPRERRNHRRGPADQRAFRRL